MDQLDIFSLMYPKYQINKPIRLIELFAGIGSQAKALKRLGANFEHYKVVEFDKYAIASYNAVHGTNFETSDITKINAEDLEIVDTDKYCYIMTYSFPCQDLSLAGKGKGMKKGAKTRSGLLWEVERILDESNNLPQILLMENVPQVHSEQNMNDFIDWQNKLESLGYQNYWQDLNAKDYGIPQNRNRCFMVSILGDYCYNFPKPFELKLRLKDMLEDKVDEKYYLSDKMISFFKENSERNQEKGNGFRFKPVSKKEANIAKTITTRAGGRMDDNFIVISEKNNCNDVGVVVVGNYSPSGHNASRIVDNEGIAPTVMENHGTVTATIVKDNRNMKEQLCDALVKSGIVKENDVIRHSYTNSRMKGEMKDIQENNISPTLDTRCDCLGVVVKQTKLRIRKLTPKECWRLMGFDDEDFDKAAKVNSNSQLYKQAGNSIVVNVLECIFKELLED